MYFPYIRGRQYELLALRELVLNGLLKDSVIPIIEPVKLSPTLTNTMEEFVQHQASLAVIQNPSVGTFIKDWDSTAINPKNNEYKERIIESYRKKSLIRSIIMKKDARQLLNDWKDQGIDKSDLLVINTDRDFLGVYDVKSIEYRYAPV